MKRFVLVGVMLAALPAAADPEADLFLDGNRGLLVKLDGDDEATAKLLATTTGAVRCIDETDGVIGAAGGDMPVVGCYVVVRRNGKLAPPSRSKRRQLNRLMSIEGGVSLTTGTRTLDVTISGAAADAIALWADCTQASSRFLRGDLECGIDEGMAGKLSYEVHLHLPAR